MTLQYEMKNLIVIYMRIVEMDKNIYHKGSCCCGAVKYSIIDHPLFTHACHCKDCKNQQAQLL